MNQMAARLGWFFYALLFTSNISARPLFVAIWLQKKLVSGLSRSGS